MEELLVWSYNVRVMAIGCCPVDGVLGVHERLGMGWTLQEKQDPDLSSRATFRTGPLEPVLRNDSGRKDSTLVPRDV